MTDPHKIRVRIGENEFEASGPEELVKEQFERWLAAIQALSGQAAKPTATNKPSDDSSGAADVPPGGELDSELIGRAFLLTNDVVSLRMLPRTEAVQSDALLLLLLGYATLRNETMVLGTQLTRAAKQSGLGVDRVDRALSRYDALLLKGGARKGSRYGLNNQGRARAQELLRQMLST